MEDDELLLVVRLDVVWKSCSIRGIIARWTGVGLTNPNLRHVDTSGGQRPKSAKVVVVLLLLLLMLELTLVIVDEEEFGRRRCIMSADIAAAPLPLLRSCTSYSMSTPSSMSLFSSVTAVAAGGRFRLESFRKRLDMMMIALIYEGWFVPSFVMVHGAAQWCIGHRLVGVGEKSMAVRLASRLAVVWVPAKSRYNSYCGDSTVKPFKYEKQPIQTTSKETVQCLHSVTDFVETYGTHV